MEANGSVGCWLKGIVVFFVMMSLAAIGGGIYLFSKNFNLKFQGVKTRGVFIEYVQSESQQTNRDQPGYNQTDVHYFPVLRYEVNGDSITSQMKSGGDEASLFPGDLAEIIYSPSDASFISFPENVNESMMVAVLSTVMGLLVLFLVIYLSKNFSKLKVHTNS